MSPQKKKYGVMGGTFNPIHLGHLVVAEEIRHKLNLDKVIFVPTGNPPHKDNKELTDAKDRYLMTLLATVTNPNFKVSSIEVEREGISYTIDTIKAFRSKYKDTEFYFITGADALLELHTWKNVSELLNLCKFVTATRPGFELSKIETEIKNLEKRYNRNIYNISVSALQISSTDIRQRIKDERSVKYLLPDPVKYYIDKNCLYR
ncbi:MAG: nicotinate-nucleotide adenylyltransferase [Firmicutes bacterium]|nr:nicotinate-nucleotide adenylyltransferase [Bacillota bacterium]MTI68749.1 nicotinate-nucleotide adenylyltransferase [Bacillota bacterium]